VVAPAGRFRISLIVPEPVAEKPVTVPEVTEAVHEKVDPAAFAVGE
jgi:hypothetical protein